MSQVSESDNDFDEDHQVYGGKGLGGVAYYLPESGMDTSVGDSDDGLPDILARITRMRYPSTHSRGKHGDGYVLLHVKCDGMILLILFGGHFGLNI